jgi:hypothetical protein
MSNPLSLGQISAQQIASLHSGSAEFNFAERSHRLMQPASPPISQTIPPERVGLQGEYDHQGLAKRVSLTIRQNCSAEQISDLRITQRGAVVVFSGKISGQRLLIKLVNLALATAGATDVEVNGTSVGDSLKRYLEVKPCPDLLLQLQSLAESQGETPRHRY